MLAVRIAAPRKALLDAIAAADATSAAAVIERLVTEEAARRGIRAPGAIDAVPCPDDATGAPRVQFAYTGLSPIDLSADEAAGFAQALRACIAERIGEREFSHGREGETITIRKQGMGFVLTSRVRTAEGMVAQRAKFPERIATEIADALAGAAADALAGRFA
jgi:hypothetical protein